jgi:carbonic anhydrase/acetyltransferase-like protein (isoleucine patch superfamily)
MTIDEIYAIPVDGEGWRVLPNGNHVRLGLNVVWPAKDVNSRIGDYSSIGDNSRIGDYSSIGNGSSIGDFSRIGNDSSIGDFSRIGNVSSIGDGSSIGNGSSIGDVSSIGDGSSIGNGSSIGDVSSIGNGSRIGNVSSIGDFSRIGNVSSIGDVSSIGNGSRIPDKTTWLKSPLAVQGTKHLATNDAPGSIQIGCCAHTFAHWTEHVLGIARQHGYSDAEGLEYQRIVAFIVANGVAA